jgi:hypothetical protein
VLAAGWAVFGIKYAVHEPLSTVLNQVAEGSYQAVASLLWKLKRAEHSLSAAWLALNSMQRAIGQVSAAAKQHNIFLPGACDARSLRSIAMHSTPVLIKRLNCEAWKDASWLYSLCSAECSM